MSVSSKEPPPPPTITDRGTLEKGKKADFIVLDKDPLVDIHNTLTISAIWKDGVKVSNGPITH